MSSQGPSVLRFLERNSALWLASLDDGVPAGLTPLPVGVTPADSRRRIVPRDRLGITPAAARGLGASRADVLRRFYAAIPRTRRKG
jgi:hypothetical protein